MISTRLFVVAVFGLFFSSMDGYAGELILDPGVLKAVSDQARNIPFRSRGGVFSRQYFQYELGRAVTPYFMDPVTGLAKRRFRSENCCFEVSFLKGSNLVRKIKCKNLESDLRLPGKPELMPMRVSDLPQVGGGVIQFFDFEKKFVLSGFLHSEDTIRMDQAVLGLPDRSSFPRQSFSVDVRTHGTVMLDPTKGLQITQKFQMKMGKLGILEPTERGVQNVVSKKPSDLVFSDGAGKVVLVNDLMLPRALQNSLMEINPRLLSDLQGLEERSNTEPVCFRDAGWGSAEQGCHRIIDVIPPLRWLPYGLLSIDFRNGNVSIVE